MNKDPALRSGRFMLVIAWLIFFAMLGLFFHYYKSVEPTAQLSHGKLTIRPNKQGHYYINGFVNEQPVKFMVDTGASLVAIPQALAQQLQLKGNFLVKIGTANGRVEGSLTRLKQLSFAGFIFKDVKAVIIPHGEEGIILLGMNILSQFDLTQKAGQLIFQH